MTCNQLMVLLDVKRGFRSSIHCGTLYEDIKFLKDHGLIEEEDGDERFDYKLTTKGELFVLKVEAKAARLIEDIEDERL